MRKYFMFSRFKCTQFNTLTWFLLCLGIENCAILFECLLHENEAVPRFTTGHGVT